MSKDWPEGWARGDRRQPDRTAVYPQGSYGAGPGRGQSRGGGGARGRGGTTRSRRPRRRRWPRVIGAIILVIVLLIVAGLVYLDSTLNRVNALEDYTGRPGDTPGTNWLMVGTDSRKGMSKEQRDNLATGTAAGQRTDSMMLLHVPESGDKPTLVSLPRDSYLPIKGHGHNKLNASFAFGGPRLLVNTVENVTGVHVDHYMEINFAGFVDVVDAVGGVHMCNKKRMKDPKAGIDLPPGCHDLEGKNALGFVRTRHSGRGDIDRVKRQRQFLSALISKATSPGVLLNPFRAIPLATNGSDAVTVDDHDHLWNLGGLAWSLRDIGDGGLITTSVPVGGFGSSPAAGSYLTWDHNRALALFNALKNDEPVPKSALYK